VPGDPVPGPDGEWDEGLAPERTQLARGRTGLAVVVAVGVLARRVWTLHGGAGLAGLVMVAVGALAWLVGMRESRRLEVVVEPHGMTGRLAFRLITTGTVLLALGALVFGILVST
jgi:uncharacterized membrane protein YidH (DUF202 family)